MELNARSTSRRQALPSLPTIVGPAVFFLLISPSVVYANAGTPLMWAGAFHLLIGNALIGIGEAWVLNRLYRVPLRRTAGIMILANYFSCWLGMFLFDFLARRFDGIQFGGNPLYAGLWLTLAGAAASYLLTIVLEWPFCRWVLSKAVVVVRRPSALRASITVQTASYLLLALFYAGCSPISLYTQADIQQDLSFVRTPRAWVYYISPKDGDVWRIRADGTENERFQSEELVSRMARLFADRDAGENNWSLYAVDGSEEGGNRLITALCAGAVAPRRRPLYDVEPNSWWNFDHGGDQSYRQLIPNESENWQASTPFWPYTGIVISKDEEDRYRLAMNTPLVSWFTRNEVRLPQDQVLYQIEDMIVILDMPSRKLGFLTFGRGPVVTLSDEP